MRRLPAERHGIDGCSEHVQLCAPFADNSFNLIVSNNGLNNVSDQRRALLECFRVSRPGAQMVLTLNLPDTMKEFYHLFELVLNELGKTAEIQKTRDPVCMYRLQERITIPGG